MSSTVAEVIVKAQRRCKGLSQARGLECYNDVIAELAKRAQFRNASATISIAAGTREYALGTDVWQIHEAYYETTSDPSTWYPLYERSTDLFIEYRRGWRATSSTNTPYAYYVNSAVSGDTGSATLGLDPVPNQATASGYPNVTIFYTGYVPMALTDTVPQLFLNDNSIVLGIRRLYAMDDSPGEVAEFEAGYEAEAAKLISHIKEMQSHGVDTVIRPAVVPQRRLV